MFFESARACGPWASIGLAAAALLVSCGSVGEPLPPLLRIPAAVEDLEIRQQNDELVLTWTYPRLTTEGTPIEPVERFEAVFAPVAEPLPPSAETLEQIGQARAVLTGAELAALSPGAGVSLRLPARSHYGQNLAVAVRSVSRRGRTSALSAPRLIRPLEPPAPPPQPAADVRQEGVVLSWPSAPGATSYVVERRVGPAEFEPLAEAPQASHLDPAPRWGEPHAYRVRARRAEPPWADVSGPPSAAVEVQPMDRFPPPPPENLRAVSGPRSVELAWAPSPESGISAYRVYRDGRLLAEIPGDRFAYGDQAAPSGAAIEYRVTAVDEAHNEGTAVSASVVR